MAKHTKFESSIVIAKIEARRIEVVLRQVVRVEYVVRKSVLQRVGAGRRCALLHCFHESLQR